jgi:uncharacterized protein
MAEACLTLYETTFEQRWFGQARSLADVMLALFGDRDGGGFFQTGSDAETLVVRPKELFDNAMPSGNSAAATVLQRLALLSGDVEYERAGVGALQVVAELMVKAPTVLGQALSALDLALGPSREVAIVGEPGAADTNGLVREVHGRFLPNVVLAVGPPGVESMVPLLADRPGIDGRATAYVCEGFACQMPVTDPGALAWQLTEAAGKT